MYSCGTPHMANQRPDGQFEHTYSSYVRIRDVTLKTCQRRWMIGRRGERGSGISVLAARHDDDDFGKIWLYASLTTPKRSKLIQIVLKGPNMDLAIGLISRVFTNGPGNRGSYQRLKKWYLMPPCLAFSIIRLGLRVKWSNLGKGVAPSPTPRCSSYWKGILRVTLD